MEPAEQSRKIKAAENSEPELTARAKERASAQLIAATDVIRTLGNRIKGADVVAVAQLIALNEGTMRAEQYGKNTG